MEKEYSQWSNHELEEEMKSLEETFAQYHSILTEAYESMYDLSLKYKEITEILNQRNGR